MSLYLKVGIGAGRYLLDAGGVLEIRSDDAREHRRGEGGPVVDCRDLFDEPAGTRGDGVLIGEEDGVTTELIVDRVEGLVEIADAELRPVPPIGLLGQLIDAISVLADEPPMLRLRAKQMRATAAALGCGAER